MITSRVSSRKQLRRACLGTLLCMAGLVGWAGAQMQYPYQSGYPGAGYQGGYPGAGYGSTYPGTAGYQNYNYPGSTGGYPAANYPGSAGSRFNFPGSTSYGYGGANYGGGNSGGGSYGGGYGNYGYGSGYGNSGYPGSTGFGMGGSNFGGSGFGGSRLGSSRSIPGGGLSGRSGGIRTRDPRTGRFSSQSYGQQQPYDQQYGDQYQQGQTGQTRQGSRSSRYNRSDRYNRNDPNQPAGSRRGSRSSRLRPGETPPPGQTPGPGGPASQRPGQMGPGQTARGAARTPPPGAAGAQGAGVTAVFQYRPNVDTAVLFMTPLEAQAPVNEEFETHVALANPGSKSFEKIQVTLRYDPMLLEPVRLDDEQVRPLLADDAKAVVYTESGILTYEAALDEASSARSVEVFTIRWKALAPAPFTKIDFTQARGQETALLDDEGKSILGGTASEGTLGMTVVVFSPEDREKGPPIGEAVYAENDDTSRGSVQLRLVTNAQRIPASEDFYVGVWFENPRFVDVSKIRFTIRFDPRVLEVVDDDTKNWIADGVNIFDGDYHEDFPFDIHVANTVVNETGRIDYAMSCTKRRVFPDRGYLARIRFRPRSTVNATRIAFEFTQDNQAGQTEVSYLGADVLGNPTVRGDGTENLVVQITRPRLPKALAEER